MALAAWKNGDIVYRTEGDNGGGYAVYRYRTAGGRLYREVAYAGFTSRDAAERQAATWQARVDAGMGWQAAER